MLSQKYNNIINIISCLVRYRFRDATQTFAYLDHRRRLENDHLSPSGLSTNDEKIIPKNSKL